MKEKLTDHEILFEILSVKLDKLKNELCTLDLKAIRRASELYAKKHSIPVSSAFVTIAKVM